MKKNIVAQNNFILPWSADKIELLWKETKDPGLNVIVLRQLGDKRSSNQITMGFNEMLSKVFPFSYYLIATVDGTVTYTLVQPDKIGEDGVLEFAIGDYKGNQYHLAIDQNKNKAWLFENRKKAVATNGNDQLILHAATAPIQLSGKGKPITLINNTASASTMILEQAGSTGKGSSTTTNDDYRIMQGNGDITVIDTSYSVITLEYAIAQIQGIQLAENGDVTITLRNDNHTDDNPSMRTLILKGAYSAREQSSTPYKKVNYHLFSSDGFSMALPLFPDSKNGAYSLMLQASPDGRTFAQSRYTDAAGNSIEPVAAETTLEEILLSPAVSLMPDYNFNNAGAEYKFTIGKGKLPKDSVINRLTEIKKITLQDNGDVIINLENAPLLVVPGLYSAAEAGPVRTQNIFYYFLKSKDGFVLTFPEKISTLQEGGTFTLYAEYDPIGLDAPITQSRYSDVAGNSIEPVAAEMPLDEIRLGPNIHLVPPDFFNQSMSTFVFTITREDLASQIEYTELTEIKRIIVQDNGDAIIKLDLDGDESTLIVKNLYSVTDADSVRTLTDSLYPLMTRDGFLVSLPPVLYPEQGSDSLILTAQYNSPKHPAINRENSRYKDAENNVLEPVNAAASKEIVLPEFIRLVEPASNHTARNDYQFRKASVNTSVSPDTEADISSWEDNPALQKFDNQDNNRNSLIEATVAFELKPAAGTTGQFYYGQPGNAEPAMVAPVVKIL